MDNDRRFLRRVLPLVVFLFIIPLACALNTSIPTTQKASNPGSTASGTTRKNPIPIGKLISIPGWDIKVVEFLRGEAALAVINTPDWQANPLPAGQEYALAKIFVRCTSLDDSYHSLGISQMFITGSDYKGYGDTMDSWPQPEFLFEDMFTAETVEGWIDAVIPTDEQNLMVVVDDESNGNRTTRFFALEAGASISLPGDLSNLKPNDLGVDVNNPVPPGQAAVSPAWEISTLDSIRGQEAETIIEKDNGNYSPPESGTEYLLLQVKLRYIDPTDQPVWIGGSNFYAVDESGGRFSGDWIYLPTQSDRVWLSSLLLPGAELQGWVAVIIPAGAAQPVIAFDPGYSTSGATDQKVVYLAVK